MYRNIPLEIRKEYGEPMSEVLKGYARMGYSQMCIAAVLGIGNQAMYSWVKRLGLGEIFCRVNYNEACRPKGKGWVKGRPRKQLGGDV